MHRGYSGTQRIHRGKGETESIWIARLILFWMRFAGYLRHWSRRDRRVRAVGQLSTERRVQLEAAALSGQPCPVGTARINNGNPRLEGGGLIDS